MRDVLAALAAHARRAPDRPAICDAEGCVTYGELADAVRRTAVRAEELPATVGLLAPKDRRAIVWYLALAWSGKTIVPLPEFFAPAQLEYLVRDAGVGAIVATPELAPLGRRFCARTVTPEPAATLSETPAAETRCVIYTSGTTGRPKGVVLGARQLGASVGAMIGAIGATADDRMLSVLPFALLLEQVAGLAVPLTVGAPIVLCPTLAALPETAEAVMPTATILVPEMLAAWVAWLERSGRRAPSSLRFVAVGGAPVPVALAERAWAVGLPVYEGYGLSECCSVVAVNRPGDRAAGTVGRPLPGVTVAIDNGEIVVSGPTVMYGYLGGAPSEGVRRTGDAGYFDAQRRLVVTGRIDDVIVTTTGRNIHPEWIESMLLADPRIGRCAVVDGGRRPRAVVVPSAADAPWADDVDALVERLCGDAPEYARPHRSKVMREAELARLGLITSNGRLRRRAIASYLKETS